MSTLDGENVATLDWKDTAEYLFGRRTPFGSPSTRMDFTNCETPRTIPVVVDYVVSQQDGCLLAEAIFSGLVDLTVPSVDLAAR